MREDIRGALRSGKLFEWCQARYSSVLAVHCRLCERVKMWKWHDLFAKRLSGNVKSRGQPDDPDGLLQKPKDEERFVEAFCPKCDKWMKLVSVEAHLKSCTHESTFISDVLSRLAA